MGGRYLGKPDYGVRSLKTLLSVPPLTILSSWKKQLLPSAQMTGKDPFDVYFDLAVEEKREAMIIIFMMDDDDVEWDHKPPGY